MLGTAQLPPERIVGRLHDPMPPEESPSRLTVSRDPHDPRIRVVSAPPISEASAAAAEAVATTPAARERDQLAKPHAAPEPSPAPPTLRSPTDLRALVGQRDKRDPIEATLAWARELGLRIETTGMTG